MLRAFISLLRLVTSQSISSAHNRSVDYNPNKPLVLITAGNDRKVKFWDSRNLSRPVKILAGHSHWVWSAKFNPNHDQLVVRYAPCFD